MNELIFSLLLWIGDHSSYDIYLQHPNIAQLTPHNLCQHYGIDHKDRCEGMRLIGFYDTRQTIFLRTQFDSNSLNQQSHLLHEMVHYVQWSNGLDSDYCLGQLELEAYELQDMWRIQNGLPPVLGDFNAMMLAASCED
ncbi:MAG: DUF6647 family protein [Gammaproteobacteria bacterium]